MAHVRVGEIQRGGLTRNTGYSATAHCTGTRSYLEPNSGSLHVPIEGVYRVAEKIEDRSSIGGKHNQNYVENAARTYLERIRNGMQKPIEGATRIGCRVNQKQCWGYSLSRAQQFSIQTTNRMK